MNDFENEHYKEKRNKWILITLNIALCAYLVVYYTEKNFSSFCASFDEYLHQYSYPYPVIYDLTVLDSDYSELFQAVITLNRNGKPMRLYFIAIHIPNK